MSTHVLAVDIGGTKTAATIVDSESRVIDKVEAPTPGAHGPDAVIETVAQVAGEAARRAGIPEVQAVGIAAAGVVDSTTGTILSATETLADWAGTPVAARVRSQLGSLMAPSGPIVVVNDVDAHAVGEHRFGAAVGSASALVVAVGTGIGAGIILDGRVWRGARHVAGEFAHVPVPGTCTLRCPCGRLGHLEAIGSGVGMHRLYLAIGGRDDVRSARTLARLAAEGDDTAQRAIAESAAAVGRAIAGAVSLIDPECVVITGGVPAIGDLWWRPMREQFLTEAIDVLQEVPILPGTLGDHAPLRGVGALAWDQLGECS
ncbi:ROK family protein [Demequina muriae]|uniref:ROK family protein n=1 Tax=Demequina muriae TaxID=3051664 RepID=A0ABT8GFP8_9MICO|nr:ROK family protein [Demequina sp. EGI L300058]MDN4480250.1 ROK family protein [Demequina sp. EGI L300058]